MALEVIGQSFNRWWVADSNMPPESTNGMLHVRAWNRHRKQWHDAPPQPLEGIERFTTINRVTPEEAAEALAEIKAGGGYV